MLLNLLPRTCPTLTAVIPVPWVPWPGRLMAPTSPRRVLIRRCRCGSQGKDRALSWNRATARVAPTFLIIKSRSSLLSHPARLFPAKEQGDRKGRPYIFISSSAPVPSQGDYDCSPGAPPAWFAANLRRL